jgi:HTH-type transcriptional regulator/antitoxin MqsA
MHVIKEHYLAKKSQIFTYKGKSITLEQPGSWCNSCDEGILNGDDISKTEKAFEKFTAKIDGLLRPTEQTITMNNK